MVVKRKGQDCWDIELTPYLPNTVDQVSLVLDLHITHDRRRLMRLTLTRLENISNYIHYNNNPSNPIVFMSSKVSTSGKLHSEFGCFLFLQDHRETDHFFETSGDSRCSLHNLKRKSVAPSSRLNLNVLTLTLTGCLSLQE
jgi:hypothetical protein